MCGHSASLHKPQVNSNYLGFMPTSQVKGTVLPKTPLTSDMRCKFWGFPGHLHFYYGATIPSGLVICYNNSPNSGKQ